MPNTLVHFAAQGAASRALWRRLDPRFLYLGCVLPDLPWILRRAIVAFGVPVDAFDLRLYTMGLASLAITLLLAAAVAVATTAPRRVFAWLGLNALLHLLLDATEIKFGNGVHLLAPFSWRMTSFELLPGESPVYLLLTIGGALLVLWDIARRRDGAVGWERRPRSWVCGRRPRRGIPRRAAAVPLRDRGVRQLFGEDAAREGRAQRPPRQPRPRALRREPGGRLPRALDRRARARHGRAAGPRRDGVAPRHLPRAGRAAGGRAGRAAQEPRLAQLPGPGPAGARVPARDNPAHATTARRPRPRRPRAVRRSGCGGTEAGAAAVLGRRGRDPRHPGRAAPSAASRRASSSCSTSRGSRSTRTS